MEFSIFEGQEPSQLIFQVRAPLRPCHLDFAGSLHGLLLLYWTLRNKTEA